MSIEILGVGLATGLLSGLFGIGGGVLLVPLMGVFLNLSQKSAQGTSLFLLSLPVSVFAVIQYARGGNVNFRVGLHMIPWFVIGSVFGAVLMHYVPCDVLKKVFGAIVIVAGLKMLFV